MKEYYWDDKGHCTNGDVMYYKSHGILVSYQVAKNKHGYARTFDIVTLNMSVCRPLSWNEEDVCATKEEAVSLVKSELKQMLISTNYNNQFDVILMAMGEIALPQKQIKVEQQLTLF